jgi:hypothetical protein
MFYAEVNGIRRLAEPELVALCPLCRQPVLAKCGAVKAWHWAHRAGSDCDAWAEPVGAWHLSWQALAPAERVEVALGLHRADIVGDDDMVIELQHSPIGAAEIERRERYYGRMVWLFDATCRFRLATSGEYAFFALSGAEAITACTEPVCLDFGSALVEVTSFTRAFAGCSGFGRLRDRRWFLSRYLPHSFAAASSIVAPAFSVVRRGQAPAPPPCRPMEHRTRWLTADGSFMDMAAGTPYIPADHDWPSPKWGRLPVWREIIEQHPMLAGGWTKSDFERLKSFFQGSARIIDGRLRLIPAPAAELRVTRGAPAAELLQQANSHISAGRMPWLKLETKEMILRRSGAAVSAAPV